MEQHKWHKEIKAWADGAEIEQKGNFTCGWSAVSSPNWESDLCIYRIKPPQHCCCDKQTCSALKEPQYLYVYKNKSTGEKEFRDIYNFVDTIPNSMFIYLGKIKLEVED